MRLRFFVTFPALPRWARLCRPFSGLGGVGGECISDLKLEISEEDKVKNRAHPARHKGVAPRHLFEAETLICKNEPLTG